MVVQIFSHSLWGRGGPPVATPMCIKNNGNKTMLVVLSRWLRVIATVHPVYVMNAEQRQTAADLWNKPWSTQTWATGPPVNGYKSMEIR